MSAAPARPALVGPLDAFLRHPLFTLIPLALAVAIAAAIGLARFPTYTAEARLNVGRINVPAFTLQGVVLGNQALAATYARAVGAPAVVKPAARAAHTTPAAARDRLSASQIPEGTLIRIEATGPDKASPIHLANAAARALIVYIAALNKNSDAVQLLAQYSQAASKLAAVTLLHDRAQRDFTRHENPSTRRALVAATARRARALLQAQSLASVYGSSLVNAPGQNLVQLIVPASSVTSDQGSVLSVLLLIGAVAGLVLGLVLSLLRANRPLIAAARR